MTMIHLDGADYGNTLYEYASSLHISNAGAGRYGLGSCLSFNNGGADLRRNLGAGADDTIIVGFALRNSDSGQVPGAPIVRFQAMQLQHSMWAFISQSRLELNQLEHLEEILQELY